MGTFVSFQWWQLVGYWLSGWWPCSLDDCALGAFRIMRLHVSFFHLHNFQKLAFLHHFILLLRLLWPLLRVGELGCQTWLGNLRGLGMWLGENKDKAHLVSLYFLQRIDLCSLEMRYNSRGSLNHAYLLHSQELFTYLFFIFGTMISQSELIQISSISFQSSSDNSKCFSECFLVYCKWNGLRQHNVCIPCISVQ